MIKGQSWASILHGYISSAINGNVRHIESGKKLKPEVTLAINLETTNKPPELEGQVLTEQETEWVQKHEQMHDHFRRIHHFAQNEHYNVVDLPVCVELKPEDVKGMPVIIGNVVKFKE